jgi:hypothetical protein
MDRYGDGPASKPPLLVPASLPLPSFLPSFLLSLFPSFPLSLFLGKPLEMCSTVFVTPKYYGG